MNCAFCNEPAVLVTRWATYRRGQKSVKVGTECWSCPGDCEGPDGRNHYEFYDVSQLKANDEAAKKMWEIIHKEPMPKSAFQASKKP